jgi:hypothetical protein
MWTEALFEVRKVFGYFRAFYEEKSKLTQLVKKFNAFYGNQALISVFTADQSNGTVSN